MTARASTAAAEPAGNIESQDDPDARPSHDRALRAREGRDAVRINLTLSPRTAARLDELKDISDAASTAEVVRSALRVYDFIVEQVAEGNEVCIRSPDGTITATKIFV